ncbi:MAG: hypothetical protein JXA25_04835 [Anaerolineales bacterium]|nr:hypothetical protein [Anaerolineales bacterium]
MGKKNRNTSRSSTQQAGSSRYGKKSKSSFNPDYTYVIKDLKRIAVIAAALILGLVGLSFII